MSSPLQQLEARVAALEAKASGGGSPRVSGWEAAARVLDMSAPTVKRLAKNDTNFPKPVRSVIFIRKGRKKPCVRPEFRRTDLIKYHTHHG